MIKFVLFSECVCVSITTCTTLMSCNISRCSVQFYTKNVITKNNYFSLYMFYDVCNINCAFVKDVIVLQFLYFKMCWRKYNVVLPCNRGCAVKKKHHGDS